MRIYLAGPMRGIPDFNYWAFKHAAAQLRAQGHVVFSPPEHDIETSNGVNNLVGNPTGDEAMLLGKSGLTRRQIFCDDLNWICKYADAVALLPGWKNSKGATAEHAVAEALGLEIIEL